LNSLDFGFGFDFIFLTVVVHAVCSCRRWYEAFFWYWTERTCCRIRELLRCGSLCSLVVFTICP